jgi:acyl dehydratase
MSVEIPFEAFPPVSPPMLKEYAAASGDSNPIHLDEQIAKASGLPGIIAHGMLIAAWIGERAVKFAREDGVPADLKLREFSTRFRAMVFPGDVISVGGTVKESSADSVTLELQARNQKGEVTTTGVARFGR